MLFDEDVAAILSEHFVCVLTDAPWSRISQRNADTWEEMEGWKSSPRNSEIVFIVSADKRDRRGLVYSRFKEPAQLLAVLEELLREDGKVEIGQQERDALVVRNRMRARATVLRRALREGLGEQAKPAVAAFDAFAQKVSDQDLCPADRLAETRTAMLADEPDKRAELRERVAKLLEHAAEKQADDPVVVAIRTAQKTRPDDLGDVTGLLFAEALLRRRVGSL